MIDVDEPKLYSEILEGLQKFVVLCSLRYIFITGTDPKGLGRLNAGYPRKVHIFFFFLNQNLLKFSVKKDVLYNFGKMGKRSRIKEIKTFINEDLVYLMGLGNNNNLCFA